MTKPTTAPDDQRPDFEVAEGPPRLPELDENLLYLSAEQAAIVDAASGAIDTATTLARETQLLTEDEIDRRVERLSVDVANQADWQHLMAQRLANEARAPRPGSAGLEATEAKVASLTDTLDKLDEQIAAHEAVLLGLAPAADGREWQEPTLPHGRSPASRFWEKAWVKVAMVPLELFVMIPTFALALNAVLWPNPGGDVITTAEVAAMAVLGAVGVIALPVAVGVALANAIRSPGRWIRGFGLGWILTPLWFLALGAVGYARSKPLPDTTGTSSLATAETASQFQPELALLIVPLLLAAGAVVVWHTLRTHNPYVDGHIKTSALRGRVADQLKAQRQSLADITRQVSLQDEAIVTNRITFNRALNDGLPATAEAAKAIYTRTLANAMSDPQVTDGLLARATVDSARDNQPDAEIAADTASSGEPR